MGYDGHFSVFGCRSRLVWCSGERKYSTAPTCASALSLWENGRQWHSHNDRLHGGYAQPRCLFLLWTGPICTTESVILPEGVLYPLICEEVFSFCLFICLFVCFLVCFKSRTLLCRREGHTFACSPPNF